MAVGVMPATTKCGKSPRCWNGLWRKNAHALGELFLGREAIRPDEVQRNPGCRSVRYLEILQTWPRISLHFIRAARAVRPRTQHREVGELPKSGMNLQQDRVL